MTDDWPPWLRALSLVDEQSGGVFNIVPMMQQEIGQVIDLAHTGDTGAALLAAALLIAHEWIERPHPNVPHMVCVGCTRPLAGHPRSFGLVVPHVPEPSIAVALAVCPSCGPDPAAIMLAVRPCLRIVWPRLRQIGPVMSNGGRA